MHRFVRTALISASLMAATTASAFAAEPGAGRPSNIERAFHPYGGWGSGLIAFSLIDSIKKDGPIRAFEPAFKGFQMTPVVDEQAPGRYFTTVESAPGGAGFSLAAAMGRALIDQGEHNQFARLDR